MLQSENNAGMECLKLVENESFEAEELTTAIETTVETKLSFLRTKNSTTA